MLYKELIKIQTKKNTSQRSISSINNSENCGMKILEGFSGKELYTENELKKHTRNCGEDTLAKGSMIPWKNCVKSDSMTSHIHRCVHKYLWVPRHPISHNKTIVTSLRDLIRFIVKWIQMGLVSNFELQLESWFHTKSVEPSAQYLLYTYIEAREEFFIFNYFGLLVYSLLLW